MTDQIDDVLALWAPLIDNPLDDAYKGILADYLEERPELMEAFQFSSLKIPASRVVEAVRQFQNTQKMGGWYLNSLNYPNVFPSGNPSIKIEFLDGLPAKAITTFRRLPLLVNAARELPIKRVEMPDLEYDKGTGSITSDLSLLFDILRLVPSRFQAVGFEPRKTTSGKELSALTLHSFFEWHVYRLGKNRIDEETHRNTLSDLLVNWARYEAHMPFLENTHYTK